MKNATSIKHIADLGKEDAVDLESLYVETLAEEVKSDRQGVFHPSAIGMCGRRNVYEYIRAPYIKTIDPDSLEVFAMGHAVHDIIQTRLENLTAPARHGITYSFRKEVGFDPKTDKLFLNYGIGGTTDGILTFSGPGWEQRGILEAKSIKDKLFSELTGPKDDHLMQAHLYAYRFDCPFIWVWYYNKNTSERLIYARVFDPEILHAALDRYVGWMGHIKDGTLPDREESWYMCPRCEYRDICKPPTLDAIKGKAAGRAKAKTMNTLRKTGMRRLVCLD